MKTILVTGGSGFIGRNLCTALREVEAYRIFSFDIDDELDLLEEWLRQSDIVFHLAGVNRPLRVEEFEEGNAEFTNTICCMLRKLSRRPKIVMSSSIQAELDNPYGVSKRRAEQYLKSFGEETNTPVLIFRLKNVFGKWCKPEYNSVVATFCHHIANDLPITISDPQKEIELIYIDDVVQSFLGEARCLSGHEQGGAYDEIPSTKITLEDLAGRIQFFHEMATSLRTPDFASRFNHCLYATYLSYVSTEATAYDLIVREDQRGSLAEFMKSDHFGQIFVSRTRPGITRGNHYHHTKTEKFFVVAGEGLIRMRRIDSNQVHEYRVSGKEYRVVDIPPGVTHSITNVGSKEMVTLFWASEVFDPDRPDTYYLDVDTASPGVVSS